MVVDDSPVVRERLIALLSEIDGVQIVGQADTAQGAIDLIPQFNPSVLVLDISMPGGSGFLVLEHLQKNLCPPLIIVLTNYDHEPYRRRAFKLGADYFFDKSSQFEEIKAVLEKHALLLPQPSAPVVVAPAKEVA
jgi:two-component system, NarL family, response regulator DevR